MGPTKVYVVAEFEALRIGLGSMLDAEPDMRRVGQAGNLREMTEDKAIRQADVLLLDAKVLNRSSLEEDWPRLATVFPSLRVLVFGASHDVEVMNVEKASSYLRFNSVGFLFNEGAPGRLLDCVRLVASGMFVWECEMEVVRHLSSRLARWARYTAQEEQDPLSDRETEVLRLVAEGMSNKEIAEQLSLSEGTVKIHVSHIMAKLALDRRTELVRYAISSGVAPLES